MRDTEKLESQSLLGPDPPLRPPATQTIYMYDPSPPPSPYMHWIRDTGGVGVGGRVSKP
jgi:hypothetical protein